MAKKRVRAESLLRDRFADSARSLSDQLAVAVREGDPATVHQSRVAIRRLRTWIRAWDPLLDDPRLVVLDEHLTIAMHGLGAIRDLDVIDRTIERVDRRVFFADLVTSQVRREVVHRRRAALARAGTTIPVNRILAETRQLDGSTVFSALAHKPASRVMPPLVKAQWRHLVRRVEELPEPLDPASLHRVRIAAKRCRYSALDVVPAVGKPAKRFAKSMGRLQDRIGRIEDGLNTAVFLEQLGQHGGTSTATTAGVLRGVTLGLVADGLDRWPDWWADASREDLRNWW